MTKGIYSLTFPNGKQYWGTSKNIEHRYAVHKYHFKMYLKNGKSMQPKLHKAMAEFGFDSIKLDKYPFDLDKKDLYLIEQKYISDSNSYNDGYNDTRYGSRLEERHWYTNGIQNIKSRICPDGYKLGRTIKP